MTNAAPRLVVLIVLALALAAGFFWVARRQVAAPPTENLVVVREGDAPSLAQRSLAPAAVPTNTVAPAARDASATDRAILRALGMPAGATLIDVIPGNAAAQASCGLVAPAPNNQPGRFVYLGLAGLGALDDGGADFAQLHDRMCPRR
ncbi:hypothetical protein SAMN05216382_1582 [Sphingomonas palmae]|uniref:Uncharacterized protein n=1 Tax=Sphingomonas palmae TaxID=1855283 RepID=A0A1H7MSE5_9SPHN|nr:hypothetical protein [Sphingomonas palmae]SEL14220.1 hypothetical protein SAMN05216382_1582 [Sphingomonas palmae]